MSAEATFWAWKQPVKSTQLLVLLSLANFANDEQQTWYSYNRIAMATKLSRRSVIDAVAALCDMGLVSVQQRKKTDQAVNDTNVFTLHTQVFLTAPLVKGGAGAALGVVQEIHQGGAGAAPESNSEPNRESKKRDTAAKASASSRGSRLPKDWTMPDDWLVIAQTLRPEWPDSQIRLVADRFRDHWVAKPGKDGVKLDWLATWRNWCRNEKAYFGRPAQAPVHLPAQPEAPRRRPMFERDPKKRFIIDRSTPEGEAAYQQWRAEHKAAQHG